MTTISLPSFAKINLDLRILGVRPDGYHDLRTVFQTLALADRVIVTRRSGPFVLTCNRPDVPTDRRNLVWKARDVRMVSRITEYETQARSYRAANTHVRGLVATGPPYDAGSGTAMFEDIAAQWARSSRQMHAVSAAHGIRYFHFLQPNQYYQPSKELTEEELSTAFRKDHPYRRGVELGYPELRARGRTLVERTDAEPELTVDERILAPLFNGHLRPSTAYEAGLVGAAGDGALERADRVFAVKRTPYFPDHF